MDESNDKTDAQDTSDDDCREYDDDSVATEAKTKNECHICKRKLADVGTLKAHINKHLGLMPFQCDLCDKAYSGRRGLIQHMRTHKRKPVTVLTANKTGGTCDICNKHFARKHHLIGHMKCHTKQ